MRNRKLRREINFVDFGVQRDVGAEIGLSVEYILSLFRSDPRDALALRARPRQILGVGISRHQILPELMNVAYDLKRKI